MSQKPAANHPQIAGKIPAQHPKSTAIPSFDDLADSAFIREAHMVQSHKRPGTPAPIPFSAPTLWRKVKAGTFPAPHKLSDRVTAWRVGDIRQWLKAQSAT
jgi:prophage regulatory protein